MALDRDTLSMPCVRVIGGGLYDGLEVRLEGSIPQQSKGFKIEFLYGQFQGANVSLKFNLSFQGPPASSFAVVTLNSREKRQWGKEEKTHSTLRPGQNFKLRFTVTRSGYKIMENDRVPYEFRHPLRRQDSMHYLQIDGGVTLTHLSLK